MKRVLLCVAMLGCGKSKVPTYDDAVKAQLAKVAPCKPFTGNTTGAIKESYSCDAPGVHLLVNVTTRNRLWYIKLEVMVETAAAAKPKVDAVFTGLVTDEVLQAIYAHLDDVIAPAGDPVRREVGGVAISVGSQALGTTKKFDVGVSFAP